MTITDEQLRSLMTRVEELTPPPPDFDALRVHRRANGQSSLVHARSWTALAVAASFALLIVGLLYVRSHVERSPLTPTERLTTHSVAARLPEGWEIKGATDGTGGLPPEVTNEFHLFATEASPDGPVVAVVDSWNAFVDPATQTNVVLADGRRAALGTTHFANARSLDVEVAPGRWVEVIARHLSDTDLMEIGTLVQADAAGIASLGGPLPLSLLPAGDSSFFGTAITADFGSEANELPLGAAVVGYGPAGAPTDTSIRALDATPSNRAMLALMADVTRLTALGGAASPIYSADFSPNGGSGAYMERNGIGFLATSPNRDAIALSEMLQSLRPIAAPKWAALVKLTSADGAPPPMSNPVETTQVPPPTVTAGAVTPADIVVDYLVTATPDGWRATATIPAGDVSIEVRRLGRTTIIDASLDGTSLGSAQVTTTGSSVTMPVAVGGSSFFAVVAPDDSAAELRVTDGDTVYVTRFVTVDRSEPMRIAMILVPPRPGRVEPPHGYTYDAEGNALDPVP